MSNYFTVEHKFNVGDEVDFRGFPSKVISISAYKFTADSYGYIDVTYTVRAWDAQVFTVRGFELELIKEEDIKDEVENQTTIPSDSF